MMKIPPIFLKGYLPRCLSILVMWVLLISCSPVIKSIRTSEVYSHHHTGFYLLDPVSGRVLADYNGHKYFTPASNTKIFTLYTAFNVLGDSIPAFYYRKSDDSLIVWGTGDPTFLHPKFPDSQAYNFLEQNKSPLYLSFSNFKDKAFGPGWAWDDYPYYFQPEKAPFPIYGNVVRITNRQDTAGIRVKPGYFEKMVYPDYDSREPGTIRRDPRNNILYSGLQPDSLVFERSIPFKYSSESVAALLSDTLHRPVNIVDLPFDSLASIFYSTPSDSLYKVMMQESDNFFAEQILLMCSGAISDTLSSQIAISYSIENLLGDLPDPPVWKDGSGLSRYNLFTPRSIVRLWEKLMHLVPQDRLFSLLAQGGEAGTIEKWYKAFEPYIFGKTGTLSNNHCLSGFLKTRSGKILIFSFMHNNYISSSSEIKEEMQKTLWYIHEKY